MCNPVALQAGSAAFSVASQGSAVQASNAREVQLADQQAGQYEYSAKVSRVDALDKAQLIRKQTTRDIGSANTAAAASGVVVGEGSADEVNRQIYQNSEHDAYTAILSGERKARNLELNAAYTRANAVASRKSATAGQIGTVLSAASSIAKSSGWKTSPAPDASPNYGDTSGFMNNTVGIGD